MSGFNLSGFNVPYRFGKETVCKCGAPIKSKSGTAKYCDACREKEYNKKHAASARKRRRLINKGVYDFPRIRPTS